MSDKQKISFGKKFVTSVEIDKDYLKIAMSEISSKGSSIIRLIAEPISGLADEQISKILTDRSNLNNIKLDNLTAVISRDKVMVRYMRLPSISMDEIDSMVSFEITKQIPYAKEEVISDYKIIDSDDEGYSEVMLIVIHKKEISRINAIFTGSGVKPKNVRLSAEAITGWLQRSSEEEDLEQKTICLVDIDDNSTEVAIISDGKLSFSRVVPVGALSMSNDSAQTQALKKRLLGGINRSIDLYKKEKGKEEISVSKFLITGADAAIEDFKIYLSAQVSSEVAGKKVLAELLVSDATFIDKGIPKDISICALCGSFFMQEGINLIPDELRKKQRLRSKVSKLLSLSVSVLFILLILFAGFLFNINQRERTLRRLSLMLKKVAPAAEATEAKQKKLEIIREQFQGEASSLDAIYNLYKIIPNSISLIDFDYDDKARVARFRGRAKRLSDVFKLTTTLEGSEYFSNVQTRSVSSRRTQQGEVVDFQIRCNFKDRG
ncbi:pilus assembly protein PilM [Candidatus Omnitrophota bacterium]